MEEKALSSTNAIIEVSRLIKRELNNLGRRIGYVELSDHKIEDFQKKYLLSPKTTKRLSSAIIFDKNEVDILLAPVTVNVDNREQIYLTIINSKNTLSDPFTKLFYKLVTSTVSSEMLHDLRNAPEITHPVRTIRLMVPLNDLLASIRYHVPEDKIVSIQLLSPEDFFVIDEFAVSSHKTAVFAKTFSSEEELLVRNDVKKSAFTFFLRTIYHLLLREKLIIEKQTMLSRKLAGLIKTQLS